MGEKDYAKLSNAEITIRMKSMDNEYDVKKTKILNMIQELQELDYEYNKAKEELSKRGVLSNG